MEVRPTKRRRRGSIHIRNNRRNERITGKKRVRKQENSLSSKQTDSRNSSNFSPEYFLSTDEYVSPETHCPSLPISISSSTSFTSNPLSAEYLISTDEYTSPQISSLPIMVSPVYVVTQSHESEPRQVPKESAEGVASAPSASPSIPHEVTAPTSSISFLDKGEVHNASPLSSPLTQENQNSEHCVFNIQQEIEGELHQLEVSEKDTEISNNGECRHSDRPGTPPVVEEFPEAYPLFKVYIFKNSHSCTYFLFVDPQSICSIWQEAVD